MNAHRLPFLAFAVGLVLASAALADEATVPSTGSEQGITVPHALPGVRAPGPEVQQHISSPPGVVPRTGSAQGPNTPSASSEALPHPDVTAPPGLVPQTGSSQGVNTPGSLGR